MADVPTDAITQNPGSGKVDLPRTGATYADLLKRMLQEKETHDVTFCFGEQLSVTAHRNVLATRSPVFYTMFYGSMKEEAPMIKVTIQECTLDAFKVLLEWSYTNTADITAATAQTLLHAAKKYMMDELVEIVRKWLDSHLEASTACVLWQQAVLLEETAFAAKCQQFCTRNGDKTLASDGVVKLPKDLLKVLLAKDDLRLTDETIAYDAVIRWGKRQCRKSQQQQDPEDYAHVRTHVADLLQLVRLPLLSPEKLAAIATGLHVIPGKTMSELLAWPLLKKTPPADQTEVAFHDWRFSVLRRSANVSVQLVPSAGMTISGKTVTGPAPWTGISLSPNLPTTGSHYVEYRVVKGPHIMVGVDIATAASAAGGHFSRTGLMMNCNNFTPYTASVAKPPALATGSVQQGDVIGCWLDMSNKTVEFTRNGTSLGTPYTNIADVQYKFVLDLYAQCSVELLQV
eukprot:TRINITY_DN12783_c0_g1_i1.p1 TRINITY_DN12783_c0_g1~~TRINITY_DN12783_c0_g1_i1.p1  ORF type:complete len:458 (+),score=116.63 TRINITY_DN12783_c0_g1_i1:42-1415(+)